MRASIDLNTAIANAVEMVNEDMTSYGPIKEVGSSNYHQKNSYINRANEVGLELLQSGHSWAGEMYYSALLDEIFKREKTYDEKFNKGIVYANLGIAQIRNDKIDSGIAYLIAADDEDRPFVGEKYTVLNTPLWRQFEVELLRFVSQITNRHGVHAQFDFSFLINLFESQSVGDRLFLSVTLWTINQHLNRYRAIPNSMSRGRLYSALADLCLVTETLVRKKRRTSEAKPPSFKTLLEAAIPGCVHDKDNRKFYTTSTPSEFNDRLNILIALPTDTTRWISCLVLTRNYMAHRFDYLTDMQSTEDFFKDAYPKAMENTVLALLCLNKAGALQG